MIRKVLTKKRHKYFVPTAALLFFFVTMIACRFVFFLATPAGDGKTTQLFDFEHGYSLKRIAEELEAKSIISNARLFLLYSRLHGYDGRIKAGFYQLNDGMRVAEIMQKLVAGDICVKKFTVPEGYSIYQIAELLEGQGVFKKAAFLRECFNSELLDELELAGRSPEGYLFPSTYNVTPKMNEANIIRQMVGQFDKVYGQRFADRVKKCGLGKKEVITLASMIEKEAVTAGERPLISSVFLNRLKRRMPLQSDPTAVYGVRAFAGKVTKQDILRHSPYNTYQIQGLPPGPVGNPGSSAIEAVLNPSVTKYLYFVAKKDGTHHFSATLEEHNRAVHFYLKSSADALVNATRAVARNDNVRTHTAGGR